jgi:hypothetical protein
VKHVLVPSADPRTSATGRLRTKTVEDPIVDLQNVLTAPRLSTFVQVTRLGYDAESGSASRPLHEHLRPKLWVRFLEHTKRVLHKGRSSL